MSNYLLDRCTYSSLSLNIHSSPVAVDSLDTPIGLKYLSMNIERNSKT
jgi:hypothetical protein